MISSDIVPYNVSRELKAYLGDIIKVHTQMKFFKEGGKGKWGKNENNENTWLIQTYAVEERKRNKEREGISREKQGGRLSNK